jgi:hypothetical protein
VSLLDCAFSKTHTRRKDNLFLASRRGLGFLGTSEFLGTILSFFALFSASLFNGQESLSNETVFGLEFLDDISVVVNEGKASGFATTKSGTESKSDDVLGIGLVNLGEFFTDFSLGDIGFSRVQHIDHHLLARQQAVGQELAGADSHSVRLR